MLGFRERGGRAEAPGSPPKSPLREVADHAVAFAVDLTNKDRGFFVRRSVLEGVSEGGSGANCAG